MTARQLQNAFLMDGIVVRIGHNCRIFASWNTKVALSTSSGIPMWGKVP